MSTKERLTALQIINRLINKYWDNVEIKEVDINGGGERPVYGAIAWISLRDNSTYDVQMVQINENKMLMKINNSY